MKHISILILLLSLGFLLKAQNDQGQMDDKERIGIGISIPANAEIGTSAAKVLENKLRQLISRNGMGAEDDAVFVLEPEISIVSSEVTPTAPPMKAVQIDLTINLKDRLSNNIVSSTTLTLKGAGKTDDKALIQAFKGLNPKSTKLRGFMEKGKEKILEFYNTQCGVITSKAEAMVEAGQASEAFCMLLSVPQVSMECYYDCNKLAKKIASEHEIDKSKCPKKIEKEAIVPNAVDEDETEDGKSFMVNENVSVAFVEHKTFGAKLIVTLEIKNTSNDDFEFKVTKLPHRIRLFDNSGKEYQAQKASIGDKEFTWNGEKTILPDVPVKFVIEFEKASSIKMMEFKIHDNTYKLRDLVD